MKLMYPSHVVRNFKVSMWLFLDIFYSFHNLFRVVLLRYSVMFLVGNGRWGRCRKLSIGIPLIEHTNHISVFAFPSQTGV